MAGPGLTVAKHDAAAIADDFRRHVEHADSLVRAYTSLKPDADAGSVQVLGRGAWVDANLETVRVLTTPLTERLGAGRPLARRTGGAMIGAQIGVLLGYISQKVLGQYDLLLSSGGPGHLYFVGPNILATERRHGLNPADFRLWIAIHEVTHRTQFTAVPWLKPHVSTLIDRYVSGITVDAGRIRQVLRKLIEAAASGPDAWRSTNLMSLFLSEQQREAVQQMQSLMTVVEGHGNFVMDGVAQTQIPGYEHLRDALQARREKAGPAERAFQKLIALDMKYEQYTLGQSFFNDVHAIGGMDAVNLVWEKPENLPTGSELREATSWLARVQPQPALFE